MDKQAFKQRMQNLKSYRENNPGKGYIQFMEELAKAKSKEWKEDEDMTLLFRMVEKQMNFNVRPKAYMNQLRARMYEDGAISSLDELVTPSMIKSYIDKLGG